MVYWWQHAEPPDDPRYYAAPVPETGVFDEPQVCIKFNQKWAAHVDGLLERLLSRDAWYGTEDGIDFAIQETSKLLAHLLQECGDTTMLEDRPIRLTFAGEVESWDGIDWLLDRSRDPREFIPLSMPPAVPESLSVLKVTCVNAISHQLKFYARQQNNSAGDTTTVEIDNAWDNTFYTLAGSLIHANIDTLYTGLPMFYNNIGFLTAAEWWRVTNLYSLMDATFWDKVVCHMWCHISDDCTFSYENWLSLVQAIRDDDTLGDAQEWLRLMCILLGRKGLTNLGFLKIGDLDVLDPATDCDCG